MLLHDYGIPLDIWKFNARGDALFACFGTAAILDIELQPENVAAYSGKARTLLALGSYEKALETFDDIPGRDPY